MKTLQHYRHNANKDDNNKQMTLIIPNVSNEIKSAHIICECVKTSKCNICYSTENINNNNNNNLTELVIPLELEILNKNNDDSVDKEKYLIRQTRKPNIYSSSLSFTNSDDFYRINSMNKNDSVLKSKSINYYINDEDSMSKIDIKTNRNNSQSNDRFHNNDENKNGASKTSWDILCKLINCKVAFKKQYNGKKYNWIQLAGHAGRFLPGDREGFILKIMDDLERKCLELLQLDILASFVPNIDKLILNEHDGKNYTEMQDLLYRFHNPSIMDIKIGVRTFLEDDSDEKECKPRNDLYLKLIEMAPNEPTEKEHEMQAITKRRYMSWREKSTCSALYGFRIEAIKKNHVSEKEFYSVKERNEAKNHFKSFSNNKKTTMKMYQDRLIDLKNTLIKSDFFYSHELIGSSLLFVHDNTNASIWMIDFGKTRPLSENIRITHDREWQEGNHEDGYLIGINNLIDIFQESINELK